VYNIIIVYTVSRRRRRRRRRRATVASVVAAAATVVAVDGGRPGRVRDGRVRGVPKNRAETANVNERCSAGLSAREGEGGALKNILMKPY